MIGSVQIKKSRMVHALFLSWCIQGATSAKATEMSFLEAIEIMVAQDPGWEARENEIKAQQDELAPLKGAALPTLGMQWKRQNSYLRHGQDVDHEESHLVGGRFDLNIFSFGRDEARWAQHAARDRQLRYEHSLARLDAEARSLAKFFSLWAAADEVDLTNRILKLRAHVTRVASAQYEKGFLADEDRQKIELDLESINLDQREAQLKWAQAQQRLRIDLGENRVIESWPWARILSAPAKAWLASLQPDTVESLTRKHPRTESAIANLEFQTAKTQEAKATLSPTLDFSTEYERSIGEPERKYSRLVHAVTLNVPLLDGLKPTAGYRSQQKLEAASAAYLESLRRNQTLELSDYVKKLLRDADALEERERFVKTAEKIYKTNVRRFERGLVSLNDISIDEARLYAYERERNRTLLQFHESLAGFCQSMGWIVKECTQALVIK